MKIYEFGLKHDKGTITIRTAASNLESAKKSVMNSEGCPESALTWWRVVPTKKQIQGTKTILRNI